MSTLLSPGHENVTNALYCNYTYIRPCIVWMLPDAEMSLNGHTITDRQLISI